MYSVAVVEDDKVYSNTLEKYISRYEEESNLKFNITVFSDGEDIVTNYTGSYDIILMDIEMTFMDGMKAAEKIRESDKEVIIIFITNSPQYAIRGYAVDALDYVLKPINYYAFSQRIDRALTRLNRREANFISIKVKGGVVKVDEDDITYIETNNHNLIFHTLLGDYETRKTLKEMLASLDNKKFIQCNKCYVVNLKYVSGMYDTEVVVSGEKLQVSRLRKKGVLDALNDYFNEVSK